MPLYVLNQPIVEPIDKSVVKTHRRIISGDTTDDVLLDTVIIPQCRQIGEAKTQRKFVATEMKLVLNSFPSSTYFDMPYGRPFGLPDNAIRIPVGPVVAVTAVKYLAMGAQNNQDWTTVPTSDYTVDYTSEPCIITPIFGKVWQPALPQIGAIEIDFIAGYAASMSVTASSTTLNVQMWKDLAVGDKVRFLNSGGTLPSPLVPNKNYYILSTAGAGVGQYTISATSSGAAITFTDAGTGINFLGGVPAGVIGWLLLMCGTIYENREMVAVLQRGKVEQLPYVDNLLDEFKLLSV